LLVVTAIGCRDSKKPAKQTEPTPAQDPAWIDRLPEAPAATKLSLEMAAGLVRIKHDGTIYVSPPPAAGQPASDPLAGATQV
jgi:hypothetical protein